MGLAGLWSVWKDSANGDELTTFAVITCAANALLAEFHDRMSVVLDPTDYNAWLDPGLGGPELLRPCPEEWLEVVPMAPKRRREEPATRQRGAGITNQGMLF